MASLLERQLARLGLSTDIPPDAAAWKLLQERVARSYAQADQNRQMVERSLALSSREMQTLNEKLHHTNIDLESRVQERTKELIAERERTARSLHLSQALHTLRDRESGDSGEFIQAATEIATTALEVERAGIWLYDTAHLAIECQDLYRASSATHERGMRLSATDYPRYFRALAKGEVIAADEVHTDPRTSELSATYLSPNVITSMLDTPLRLGARLGGVLCLAHTGSARRWTQEEQWFAQSLADIVMRVIAQESLSNLEHEAAVLFAASPSGIALVENRVFMRCNERMAQVFGYAPGELEGQSTQTIYTSVEQWKEIGERIKSLIATSGSAEIEILMRRKAGDQIWVLIHSRALDTKSTHPMRVISYTDITDRKHAEQVLRESEARFRSLNALSSDWYWEQDA
ncbi:MAG: PAS domain S-box protein, partial [Burkholderiales bacterium]